MVKETLSASPEGIKKIKAALKKTNKTQTQLSRDVFCSRETICSLLRGNNIEKETLERICNELELNLPEIVKPECILPSLVNQLRQQVKADIETRCGTMRIFDMSQPIELGKIYTQVNILEKITSYQRKEIKELLQKCNLEDFDRFNFGRVTEERIPGKEAVSRHKKLLILGKPGAGKTTFLKHLAIQCNNNKFQGDLVPFFVTLKEFAEKDNQQNLLTYLKNYLRTNERNNLEQVFKEGKALILLDGLDEVLATDTKRVIQEIESLSNNYPNNQYLMTCRIAAKEYTFEKFTEVEIADFDWQQITDFAGNWFQEKPVKPETFLERLEKDEPIKELVSNPLLLTLLCIAFEELGDFPANRNELYKEGIDALLKKWDAKRGVQRDKVYQPLSVAKKEDLLSKIAWETFTPGDYFFKQEKAERYISEYIRNLPGANLDDEALQGDSEIVLKNIEAQHGLLVARAKHIYSFSHLTFQEYFTAREIITVRQSRDDGLQELVSHLFEKRWREVFLLAVAMSPNAKKLVLLMKQKIDNLLAEDEALQKYLQWLKEKNQEDKSLFQSEDVKSIQKFTNFYVNLDSSVARVFYFDLDFNFNFNLNPNLNLYFNLYFNLNPNLKFNCDLNPNLNLNFNLYLNLYRNLSLNLKPSLLLNRNFSLNLYRNLSLNLELAQKRDPELYAVLSQLKEQLPKEQSLNEGGLKKFEPWWQRNGKTWANDFRLAMIKYHNIGYSWQFSEAQKNKLEQYYRANQLLTQCLHQDCYVSPEVRGYIEETLLLPIAEIKPFNRNI